MNEADLNTVVSARGDISIQELWTSIENCRVRYLKCGQGDPLVLVHGLLGSSFCWRFNLRELGTVGTVYAPDMPGMGYSGRIAERECSLRTSAERLLAFMTSCGIGRADLLGSSHGGAVVMMAAAMAPTRVGRLLLAAPVHPWMRDSRLVLAAVASTPGRWLMRALAPQLGNLHGYFLRRMYSDARRIAPGTLEGYSAPIRIAGTIDHLLAIVRRWRQDLQELRSVLPELRSIPTLLIWGSKDTAVGPHSAIALHGVFESCRLELIPDAGHLPFEETPSEFNARVSAFLNEQPLAL